MGCRGREASRAVAEQACGRVRGDVQGGGLLPEVRAVPEVRGAGQHAGRDDLGRVARAMDNLVAWGQDTLKDWRKQASAIQTATQSGGVQKEQACAAEDVKHRVQLQNKLAGVCEEMCKEVGAYPKCAQCPKFVEPDRTPGVMTWDELLEHMDNLVAWGQDTLKGWRRQASAIQTATQSGGVQKEQSCAAEDVKHRVQ